MLIMEWTSLWTLQAHPRGLLGNSPQHFGTRGWLCGRQFFHGVDVGWFWDDSSTLHLLCILFLLLLHQLHLRLSGIRSQRLGTLVLGVSWD